MHHLRWVILAIAAILPLTFSGPASAEDRIPGTIIQGVQPPDQRLPGNQFNPGPCPGETEIMNNQGACTPCLANSVAGRGNQTCVCSPGFVETGRNQWQQATCVAAADLPAPTPQAPQTVEVTVPAGQFFFYADQVGNGSNVTHWAGGPATLCGAFRRGDEIYAEYNGNQPNPLLPPPLPPTNPADRSCDIVLFGAQLNNGWELVRLQNIDDSDCRGELYGATLTRRTNDPVDTTHDLRMSAWGHGPPNHGFCIIHIHEAVLRGPSTGKWEDAFGG